jgi:hypothetical protein
VGPTDLPFESSPSRNPDRSGPHDPPSYRTGFGLPLSDMVTSIDTALAGRSGNAILRVTGEPPEAAYRPLDDHPLGPLLGFAAPQDWHAVGIRCRGRARRLQSPGIDDPHTGGNPTPIVLTMLIDRAGCGAGIMRDGETLTPLQGPPEGVVADACRRALGLPTAPPPPDTIELWILIWLDRLVDAIAVLGSAEPHVTWDTIAALHPAAPGRSTGIEPRTTPSRSPFDVPSAAPIALAEASRQLAEAWPWHLLRADPEVVDTAGPPLPADIARWMDDGMFARWVLAELPELADLANAVEVLLPPRHAAGVAQTVIAAGVPWPGGASGGGPPG